MPRTRIRRTRTGNQISNIIKYSHKPIPIRMSELANKLQAKIKTYKQQIEEAEEIAALNLAKYRQV